MAECLEERRGGNSGGPGTLEQIWGSLEGGMHAVFPGPE